MKALWVVLFPDHVHGNGTEFIEGCCHCHLAVLSLVYVTQHRKLSMFSSHLSPGVHLWYDFSAHTFQIARYVPRSLVVAVLYSTYLGISIRMCMLCTL